MYTQNVPKMSGASRFLLRSEFFLAREIWTSDVFWGSRIRIVKAAEAEADAVGALVPIGSERWVQFDGFPRTLAESDPSSSGGENCFPMGRKWAIRQLALTLACHLLMGVLK